MSAPRVYTEYDRPPSEGLKCGPGLTRQSEAAACDINKIVAQFDKTGVLPQVEREALFLDVSEVGDYREAVEQVQKVNDYFMTLPAAARAAFSNDPAEFLDAATDPAQQDKLRSLGLLPQVEEVPAAAGVKEPPAAPPAAK